MASRSPRPGSTAGLVRALVDEGHTDVELVTAAIQEARPAAREKDIRKALVTEIVRRSEATS